MAWRKGMRWSGSGMAGKKGRRRRGKRSEEKGRNVATGIQLVIYSTTFIS